MSTHIWSIHEGKKGECNICGAIFSQNSYKKIHIQSVNEGKNPLNATNAKDNFKKSNILSIHILSFHEQKKPFECGVCGKKYARVGDRNRHIALAHERKKPYE